MTRKSNNWKTADYESGKMNVKISEPHMYSSENNCELAFVISLANAITSRMPSIEPEIFKGEIFEYLDWISREQIPFTCREIVLFGKIHIRESKDM